MSDLSHNLVEFYEKISSWEQEVVRGTGLSLPQMHTIAVMGSNGPLRMKDLAEKLGVVMGTLSVMIKRLQKLELVIRRENPDDLRSFHVELTEAGLEKYEEHHQHHTMLAQELCCDFSEEEQELFNKLIVKAIVNF